MATQDIIDQDVEQDGLTLADFIEDWQDVITDKVIDIYHPRYQMIDDDQSLPSLLRQPIGKQEQTIRGAVLSLGTNQGTTIVGEMGTGKTILGIVSAHMAGFKRVLILCPPHLTGKWKREVEITLGKDQALAMIVTSINDLLKLQREYQDDPRTLFVILSREKAKLSYQWKNVAFWGLPFAKGRMRGFGHNPDQFDDKGRVPYCPECSQRLIDKDGIPYGAKDILQSRKRLKCLNLIQEKSTDEPRPCGAPLWQAHSEGRRKHRIGLAEYIHKKMRHFFDLFIADEVHEYKAKNSAQGISAAALASVCKRSLVLTGTLMGGYSSTLFFLLYRFYPEFRERFNYTGESQWIQRYGFYEETIRLGEDETVREDGATSRRKGTSKKTVKEKPGLLPGALFHLIENCLFLRLSDVADDLPPYYEHIITIPMDRKPDDTGYSQASAYGELYQQVYAALVAALAMGSQRLLGIYVQSLLAYPDGCTKGEIVIDPLDKEIIADIPPLDDDRLYPKENELIRLVTEERRNGRRCLVYVTHTEGRDITGRLKQFLEREGIRSAVLKSSHPKPEDREKWVATEVEDGIDVLICHPRLVQTGLDLIEFPTIIWYETDYSVYTMRQASRRSWRIGQTLPVNVHYMTYENCLQASALALIAAKMQSSLAVEGELPEEGLSAYGDSSDNLIIMLAKQITGRMRGPTCRRTISGSDSGRRGKRSR